MDSLKIQGVISEQLFSVFLSDNKFDDFGKPTSGSVVTIGGFDTEKYSSGRNATFIPVTYQEYGYWSVELGSVTLGSESLSISTDWAVLDTGTSLLMTPSTDYAAISAYFENTGKCDTSSNFILCDCTSTSRDHFPSFTFNLGGFDFELTSEFYMYEIDQDKTKICWVLMMDAGVPFWLLGDVFLRGYYSIYDMENMQVGLARTFEGTSHWNRWIVATVVVGVLVVLAGITYAVYLCIRKKEASPAYQTAA